MKLKTTIILLFTFFVTITFAQKQKTIDELYTIKNLSINSSSMEYGVAYFGVEQIVFSSNAREKVAVKKKIRRRGKGVKYKMKEQSLFKLYFADVSSANEIMNKKVIFNDKLININYSNAVFSNDLSIVYFTANIASSKLGIYRADVNAINDWENIESLGINSHKFDVAHPALSNDNRTLYFSSNKGGFGKMDLYKAKINYDGTIKIAKNLGKNYNSKSNDAFPFVDKNDNLYFASDRKGTYGGFDLYRMNLEYDTHVIHLPKSINSIADDFSYIATEDVGFFSSNREGGVGKDDIYSFVRTYDFGEIDIEKKPIPTECVQLITGVVKDKITGKIIKNALITLLDEDANEINKITTNEDAFYQISLDCSKNYQLMVVKDDYEIEMKLFKTDRKRTAAIDVFINPIPKKEVVKVIKPIIKKPIIKAIVYDNKHCQTILNKVNAIDFELNKFNITDNTSKELIKVIEVMYKCPKTVVEVASHTDSRGSYASGLSLTQQRANALVNYILENSSLNPERLYGVGYGESRPINKCTDGVRCTEQEYQVNRRVAFTIK